MHFKRQNVSKVLFYACFMQYIYALAALLPCFLLAVSPR